MVRLRPVARLDELRLLFLAAALSIAGFVAVVAAAAGRFSTAELIVPLLLIGVFALLHLFLVAIGFVLVERLAPNLLVQQLSWLVIASGAFAATILVPRDLSALSRYRYTWALLGLLLLVAQLFP